MLSHTSWGADRTTLLKLYRSLVRSKLDYGCIIYGSARKSYLQMIDPIHNQGLRLALGALRTSPVASLYVEADEPSLYLRREKLSLQYAIRLADNPSNPAHEVTFPPNYVNLYEHFLLECGDFAQVRNNCFHVDNMKELFQDIHIDSIMTFLRQINLFNKSNCYLQNHVLFYICIRP